MENEEEWIKEFKDKFCNIDIDNVKIDEAYRLKNDNMPKSIFKYRNFEKDKNGEILSIKNLLDDTIWLSSPDRKSVV